MFDDLIKQKPYKDKKKYYICIGCDRVLRVGETCPDCVGSDKNDRDNTKSTKS
jgi:hypothetical protein